MSFLPTVFFVCGFVSSSHAQYTQTDQLNRQVSQMRGELQYLAGQLAKLGKTQGQAAPVNYSNFEVRFSALERQFQLLTGKLETLEYELGKSDKDRTRFQSQIVSRVMKAENRLSSVEKSVSENKRANEDLNASLFQMQNRQPSSVVATQVPSLTSSDYSFTAPAQVPSLPVPGSGEVGVELSSFPVGGNFSQSDEAQTFDPYQVAVPANISDVSALDTSLVSNGSVDELYAQALNTFNSGDLPAAETAFTDLLENHANSRLAGNASYWLGETHYSAKDYTKAAHQFSTGFAKYKASPKAADHLYKLALSLERLSRREEACASLRLLNKRFQGGRPELIAKAKKTAVSLSCPLS